MGRNNQLYELAAVRGLRLTQQRKTASLYHWLARDEHGRLAFDGRRTELERYLTEHEERAA